MRHDPIVTAHETQAVISEFFSKVYSWMAGALALSALVAWKASNTPAYIEYIIQHPFALYGMIIGELVLVIALAGWVRKMSLGVAIFAFLGYSLLTGLTLSTVLLVYTAASVSKVFVITAGLYGTMAVYGYATKKDLSSWGSFLIMSLIGIIIASIVNIFLNSYMIEWIVTYAGIIVFLGLTAYDNQKLKALAFSAGDSESFAKLAILGALILYLDFINLFLFLLRAFGDRR
jgi:FtsH-binding integral membrane protein